MTRMKFLLPALALFLGACSVNVASDETPAPPPPAKVNGKVGANGWVMYDAIARINRAEDTISLLLSGNGYPVSCDTAVVGGVSFSTVVHNAYGTTTFEKGVSLTHFGRVDATFRQSGSSGSTLMPAKSAVSIDSIQTDRILGRVSSEGESYYLNPWNISGTFNARLCP